MPRKGTVKHVQHARPALWCSQPGACLHSQAYTACLHGVDSGDHEVLDETVVNVARAAPWMRAHHDEVAVDRGRAATQQRPRMLQQQGVRVSLTFSGVMWGSSVCFDAVLMCLGIGFQRLFPQPLHSTNL